MINHADIQVKRNVWGMMCVAHSRAADYAWSVGGILAVVSYRLTLNDIPLVGDIRAILGDPLLQGAHVMVISDTVMYW
jgi:hypothetical protein